MREFTKLEILEMSRENNFGKCGFCNSDKGHYIDCPKIGGLSDVEAMRRLNDRR